MRLRVGIGTSEAFKMNKNIQNCVVRMRAICWVNAASSAQLSFRYKSLGVQTIKIKRRGGVFAEGEPYVE